MTNLCDWKPLWINTLIIINMQTYLKVLDFSNACTFSRVLINSLSYLSCNICVYVFSLPIFILMIWRLRALYLYILIVFISEVWIICHSLGLAHGTMVCVIVSNYCFQIWKTVPQNYTANGFLYYFFGIFSCCLLHFHFKIALLVWM